MTGGGFETPAEALYLCKKLLTIPIDGQYEQQCNAAALKNSGVTRISRLNDKTKDVFYEWITQSNTTKKIEANNIRETLDYLLRIANTKNYI